MKKLAGWILIALVAVSPALADRSVDKTVPADPNGRVSVELISGTVNVTTWDRDEVHISGTLGDDVEELDISAEGDEVEIEVELVDKKNLRDAHADLDIRVPEGSEIEIESVSGEITIVDVFGPVSVETVSGRIEVRGDPEEVEIATVSGKVIFEGGAPLRRGSFETVSGRIEVDTALGADGRLSLESVSGNVDLTVPAGTSASYEVSTFSGTIDNRFGPEARRVSKYAPGHSLEFSTGSGAADVNIESFSGRIILTER